MFFFVITHGGTGEIAKSKAAFLKMSAKKAANLFRTCCSLCHCMAVGLSRFGVLQRIVRPELELTGD